MENDLVTPATPPASGSGPINVPITSPPVLSPVDSVPTAGEAGEPALVSTPVSESAPTSAPVLPSTPIPVPESTPTPPAPNPLDLSQMAVPGGPAAAAPNPTPEVPTVPTPVQLVSDVSTAPSAAGSTAGPTVPSPAAPVQRKSSLWLWIIFIIVVLGGAAFFLFGTQTGMSLIGLGTVSTSPTAATTITIGSAATRDATRKADLVKIEGYLSIYYAANKAYPIAATAVHLNDATSTVYTSLVPTTTPALPTDPNVAQGWSYGYLSADGKSYQLTARLEDTTDPAGALQNGIFTYAVQRSGTDETTAAAATTSASTSSTTTAAPALPGTANPAQAFTFGQ